MRWRPPATTLERNRPDERDPWPKGVLAVSGPITAACYGIALGASGGAIRTIEGAVLPRWYGTAQIGELRGIVLGACVAGSAIGPRFLSIAHDLTGAYDSGIILLAAIAAATAAAAVIVLPARGQPSAR